MSGSAADWTSPSTGYARTHPTPPAHCCSRESSGHRDPRRACSCASHLGDRRPRTQATACVSHRVRWRDNPHRTRAQSYAHTRHSHCAKVNCRTPTFSFRKLGITLIVLAASPPSHIKWRALSKGWRNEGRTHLYETTFTLLIATQHRQRHYSRLGSTLHSVRIIQQQFASSA